MKETAIIYSVYSAYTVHVIGAWAPYIGEMVNVAVPLIVTKHAYVLTERIEGIAGMPNVRDHDSSIYLKLQGDALSVGGYENDPIFVDQVIISYLLLS